MPSSFNQPDLKDWCGHYSVSLRTWQCADCNRPVSEETKQRLLAAAPIAPEGYLWVLEQRTQQGWEDDYEDDVAIPLIFTDRTQIAKQLVRDWVIDAKTLRERLNQIHWYQGVYNVDLFEGWDEEVDQPQQYKLHLIQINSAC